MSKPRCRFGVYDPPGEVVPVRCRFYTTAERGARSRMLKTCQRCILYKPQPEPGKRGTNV